MLLVCKVFGQTYFILYFGVAAVTPLLLDIYALYYPSYPPSIDQPPGNTEA